ncbi:MAG: alpha/beta fold hydrolase [Devosia sp.]
MAGLLFALAALALAPFLGLEIRGAFDRKAGGVSWPVLFVGVFLCGWLFWWLLMPGWRRVSLLAGATAGVLVGSFSYPVVLGLAELSSRIWDTSQPGGGFDRVMWITGLSLMTTGFPAVVSLAAVGLVGAWALLAVAPPQSVPTKEPSAVLVSPLWRRLRWFAAGVAGFVAVVLTVSFALLSMTPVAVDGLNARPSPTASARSHQEAVAAFAVVRMEEAGMALHELCPSQLLTHGHKTEVAVIFFHGLTSCPAQGEELARSVFELGYNVYLPRMFGHGEADPDTLALADLTAEHLVDLANGATDLAQGLGDDVVVVGLSAGGTIATWIAQNRTDVDHAIPVSPFLGPFVVPPWATRAATNLVLGLPNMMFWVNPLAPVTAPESGYAFPRPSTHTLGQVMRLGQSVLMDAVEQPPAVGNISFLLNEADVAVNNRVTEELVDLWRAHDQPVAVRALEFSNHLPHDLINPHEIFGDTDLVYSLLAGMIRGEEP